MNKCVMVMGLLWMLMVGLAQAGTVTYVYTDAQGTPVMESDAEGHITAQFDYTPYGVQALGTAPNGPGYTGHVNDPDTGLVYMQARYYLPNAHFLSPDPIGPSPGNVYNFSRYAYTNNNPVTHTDPDGRCVDGLTCDAMAQSFAQHPEATKPLVPYAIAGVGLMATASGVGEVVGMVRTAIMIDKALSDSPAASTDKTFTTYTRTKADDTVYSGRTSGKGTPEQQVAARTSSADHQAKTADGYGPAKVDRNSSNPDAIRGREQQLIEQNGGARSQGGTSGNAINGVSPSNPNAARYSAACAKEFGCG